jgi:hypothetical protein
MFDHLTDRLLGLETLHRHLKQTGLKVRLVPHGETRAIAIAGRTAKLVTLRMAGSMWGLDGSGGTTTLRVGPVPLYVSRRFPIQMHWLVPVASGETRDFEANLKTHRGGLFWTGDVDQAEWTGGLLAERLNAHPDTSLAFARQLQLRDSIKVRPDPDSGCVRIIHQTRAVGRFSLLSSEILDVERRMPSGGLIDGIEWVAKTVAGLHAKKKKPKKRQRRVPV